ncbi:hypothetical protein M8J75_004449 [Diaphorina citri]|nr:hypothetical protein M8J75_004449 [Diaphorina citri]
MPPKKSRTKDLEVAGDSDFPLGEEEGTSEGTKSDSRQSGFKFREVLFDATVPWGAQARTVYELVKSMFPVLVERLSSRPALKSRLIPYEPNEENEEQEALSPVVSFHGDMHSFHPEEDDFTSTSSSEAENSAEEVDEALPYRRRLEMVRRIVEENGVDGVSRGKLLDFLTGKTGKVAPYGPCAAERDLDVDLVFTNGNHYIGRLSRLCLQGAGRLNFADGTSYVGNFENNTLSGQGRLEWPDLSWYEGTFLDNRRHGYGTFKSAETPPECVYIGNWCQGQRHGPGRHYYDLLSGDYYEGNFCFNSRHGEGTRRWADGQLYCGSWERNTIEGHGFMRILNGTYCGQWRRGRMHGHGEYVWHSAHGDGRLLPRNFNVYTGAWKRGLRHGEGVLRTAGGVTFRGTWVKGKKHGKGVLERANGSLVARVICRDDVMYLEGACGDHEGESQTVDTHETEFVPPEGNLSCNKEETSIDDKKKKIDNNRTAKSRATLKSDKSMIK